jgi:osmotically-inducible protein OsmY
MSRSRCTLVAAACLLAFGSLAACKRDSESPTAPAGRAGSAVGEDVKNVGKATEQAAKDIGHATTEFADKGGMDAWITTKVKAALTSVGLDPLHVHVDTDGKVVTLSGAVDSAADEEKAVSVAKAVKGVASVQNHLSVKPAAR